MYIFLVFFYFVLVNIYEKTAGLAVFGMPYLFD